MSEYNLHWLDGHHGVECIKGLYMLTTSKYLDIKVLQR